ncbi:MAG: DUF421 domain-containing protein [Eubacteriales bacterium]
MAAIFIRTLVIYIVLIAVMRFLGKRQIGEMQISELVTTFLLSELASQPLTNASVPIFYAVVPIVILVCLEVFFSFLPTKIGFIKKMLDSNPSIIINKGKIDRREMSRMRMSLDDLLCELHISGYASPSEIEYAILESNGRLSFFPIEDKKPATKGDISGNANDISGIAHPVIIDGKLIKYALEDSKKSESWIRSELKKSKIKDIKDVFLMTVDDSGKAEIIRKGDCLT